MLLDTNHFKNVSGGPQTFLHVQGYSTPPPPRERSPLYIFLEYFLAAPLVFPLIRVNFPLHLHGKSPSRRDAVAAAGIVRTMGRVSWMFPQWETGQRRGTISCLLMAAAAAILENCCWVKPARGAAIKVQSRL